MVSAVESVRSLPLLYCASATLLTGELTYTGNRDHNRERTHASDSRTLCCAAGQLAAGTTRSGGQLAATSSPPYNLAAVAVSGQGFFNSGRDGQLAATQTGCAG